MTAHEARELSDAHRVTGDAKLTDVLSYIRVYASQGFTDYTVYQWKGISDEVINKVESSLISLGYKVKRVEPSKEGDVLHLNVEW